MLSLVAECVFWSCILFTLHTYVIFPFLMRRMVVRANARRLRGVNTISEDNKQSFPDLPAISILIAAYNEERNIEARVRDIAAQSYPKQKLTVLIGSDGSTDETNEILQHLQSEFPWLRTVFYKSNRGKSSVLDDLFQYVDTEIIVFTDADVRFEAEALTHIVRPFQDPDVGAVAGTRQSEDVQAESQIHQQETAYLSFDNVIRTAEGIHGCLIGAHGCFFAMRRSCYRVMPTGMAFTDDFYYSMLPLEQGLRVTSLPEAIVWSTPTKNSTEDFWRKVRYSTSGFATLMRFKSLLFDQRVFMSYCFWSHRVSKWLVAPILLVLFVANLALVCNHLFFAVFFALQVSFLTVSAMGYVFRRPSFGGRVPRALTFSYYFVNANAALLLGLIRYMSGYRSQRWDTDRG